MSKFRFSIVTLLLLLILAAAVHAQADCPAFVQTTLESVNALCDATGRDQACYGNTDVEASGRTTDLVFEAPGDLADVQSIETLRLSSISLDSEQWGIALMRVRANLPDNSTDNATILLFGDVTLANVGRSTVDIEATASADIQVYLRPNDSTVMVGWARGESAIADGRLEDGSWVRVRIAGSYGWVPSALVTLDGELNSLLVLAPDETFYGPMQAFYVETGADAPPCAEAPPSGILIQTPEGVGEISLLINEVDIRLGSTAFIQQSAGTMIFCILEGQGAVTSGGVTREIPEGGYTTLAISDLRPNGELTPLEGYGPAAGLAALPTQLLPRPITIAEGLTQEQIRAFLSGEVITPDEPTPAPDIATPDSTNDIGIIEVPETIPMAGRWQVTGDAAICREPDTGAIAAQSTNLIFGIGTLTVATDGSTFTFVSPNGTSTHDIASPGQYFLSIPLPDDASESENYYTTVISSTEMTTFLSVASTAICNPSDGSATWRFIGS